MKTRAVSGFSFETIQLARSSRVGLGEASLPNLSGMAGVAMGPDSSMKLARLIPSWTYWALAQGSAC